MNQIQTTENKSSIGSALAGILMFIFVIWVVEIINHVFDYSLSNFALYPRNLYGLIGIITTPFLHQSLEHTAMNTIPLLVLGFLISVKNHHLLFRVSIFIIIIGGLGVWIFGRPAFHVGASGLVFGYFGFLLARGWYGRDFASLIIALVVLFFYGGMFFGILPGKNYISWEAHLFGFLAGIFSARVYFRGKK
jgi:membrane associated rhomboid family serine protease